MNLILNQTENRLGTIEVLFVYAHSVTSILKWFVLETESFLQTINSSYLAFNEIVKNHIGGHIIKDIALN